MHAWFLWLITGLVCIGLELTLPGLVIIFFGFGGILTALLSLIPFINDTLWLQILIFVCTSGLSLLFLRKYASPIFAGTVFYRNGINETSSEYAEVIEEITPQKDGRIKYAGTTWTARATDTIEVKSRVRVRERKGMIYLVEALN